MLKLSCFFLSAFVLLVLYQPPARATKPTLPLSLALTLDKPSPFDGTDAVATVTVTPAVDLTGAVIAFTSQGGTAAFADTTPVLAGVWPAGETRVFRAAFRLAGDRAMVHAGIDVTPAKKTHPPFGMGRTLYFIRDDDRYFYAEGDLFLAQQAQIRHDLRFLEPVPLLHRWLYKRALRQAGTHAVSRSVVHDDARTENRPP